MSESKARSVVPVGPGHLLAAFGLLLFSVACSHVAAVRFEAEPRINDGLVLTIDVVRASEEEAQRIRQAGAKWFYSPLREELALRRQTVALEGGQTREVEIRPEKKNLVLVVVADFRSESSGELDTDVRLFPPEKWVGRKLLVRVGNRTLVVHGAD